MKVALQLGTLQSTLGERSPREPYRYKEEGPEARLLSDLGVRPGAGYSAELRAGGRWAPPAATVPKPLPWSDNILKSLDYS